MKTKLIIIFIIVVVCVFITQCTSKVAVVEEFSDPKQFKQLLRSRNNVMVLFTQSKSTSSSVLKAYKDAAAEVRGIGTMVMVDCGGQGQKLCRQQKASPDPNIFHHFKDGKFHKVYDRPVTTKSLVRFMNDPTGEVPWEEEPSGKNVVHLENPVSLDKLLKKHKRVLVMFYAPWCVYCKQMKPEFAAAAAKVRAGGLGVLAAMDVVRPENSYMRTKYNITGFPTVHYFKDGEIIATYEGENKEDKIVEFMKDPTAVPVKEKETPWSEEESFVHHLTDDNFETFIKEHSVTLVMFYAPWCGHCKRLKPEWTLAASTAQKTLPHVRLAAVDATKETALAERFKVKSFPTLKFFKDGEYELDTPTLRNKLSILKFLEDPSQPLTTPAPEPRWEDQPSEVVHLTEDTFRPQLRSKRHALVMFYAPWCGHCKATKPEYEAAAEQLKDEDRMVLAAVNCVDQPALCKIYEIKGYPTFKYFRYKRGETNYEGGRKAEDFVNYLRTKEKEDPSQSLQSETITIPSSEKDALKRLEEIKAKEANPNYAGWGKLLHFTDSNYKTIFQENKHLLVLFHAKWCSECFSVKPKFSEVALNHDSNLGTLAACDVDKSPDIVDLFEIKRLPIIKYIRDGKSVTDYTGEKTVEGLKEFLKKMKTIQKDEL